MMLHELGPASGAQHGRKRVGRGIGSGKGKTSGRGHKGLKARSGSSTSGFEGGQMPLYRRLPKRGFRPPCRRRFAEVNLGRIQAAVDAGRLDAAAVVNAKVLVEAGVVRRARDGVRLLGSGALSAPLTFEVAGASRPAVAAVEQAGGSVRVLAAGRAGGDAPSGAAPAEPAAP